MDCSPWRELPEAFCKWFTVHTPFWRWAQNGVWEALCDDPDFEYFLIDGTLVRVHQHGTGTKGRSKQAVGRSRGGLTTKIMALVDGLGWENRVRFVLLPGQCRDSIGVEPLITGLDFEALIGDKVFEND